MKMANGAVLVVLLLGGGVQGAGVFAGAGAGMPGFPSAPVASGFSVSNIFPGVKFEEPVAILSPPNETNRLFIVERAGRIMVIPDLAAASGPAVFLDLRSSTISSSIEAGLLGMAFHPDFRENGFFYVFRTVKATTALAEDALHDQLSRFSAGPLDPNRALAGSEVPILTQADLSFEHNAGDVKFGPDGYLYLSVGDRGPRLQDLKPHKQPIDKNFFGGILRIDVDQREGNLQPNPHPASSGNYAIPVDNPFVGVESFNGFPVEPHALRTEFYAVGLRNPWRMCFDPVSGRLYCGDVGDGAIEEINLVEPGGNYGWPYREGLRATSYAAELGEFEWTAPVHTYAHGMESTHGNVIVAGPFYQGAHEVLQGALIFGDHMVGNVWALHLSEDGRRKERVDWLTGYAGLTSFGIDPRDGEILVANLYSGEIGKIAFVAEDTVPHPVPRRLSEAGFFEDMKTLESAAGVLPYEINVPFWSDNALKRRWSRSLSRAGR